VRNVPQKHNEEVKQFVEIWNGSHMCLTVDVQSVEKQGKIYEDDHQFGCLSWASSEGRLLYVAEQRKPNAKSYFENNKTITSNQNLKAGSQEDSTDEDGRGEQHVFREDWGDGLTGKHRPVIYVLDVLTGDVSVLENVPEHVSQGQALWAPDDAGIVFAGWCHEPYRMGVVYCVMRASRLYYIDLQSTTCVPISDETRASRSPRFSPDKSKLVYLDSQIGGPHNQASRLLLYDWNSKTTTVLVDVVTTPHSAGGFPGLYVYFLLHRCWSADGKRIILDSSWRSQRVILSINVETQIVSQLHCAGNGGSSYAMDVLGNRIIAQVSAPNIPPYLVFGNIPVVGQEDRIAWTPLDEIITLEDITWKVLQHRRDGELAHLDYESVLLLPARGTGMDKPALIVHPHGGPHTGFLTEFDLYVACLCRAGFAVLQVNNRGSDGFGDENLRSLLGRIGDQDVKDVQAAVESVLQNEHVDKVLVMGTSHGGSLTTHLIGQYPGVYKAACCRSPCINMATMSGITDIPDWNYTSTGLSFSHSSIADDNVMATFWKASPLQYVNEIKTPTMIVLSEDDRRVPPKQGLELYKALKARRVPVRLLWYKDSGHDIAKPDSQADCLVNTARWFKKYI
jgi:acylaminoacyl-peptidase